MFTLLQLIINVSLRCSTMAAHFPDHNFMIIIWNVFMCQQPCLTMPQMGLFPRLCFQQTHSSVLQDIKKLPQAESSLFDYFKWVCGSGPFLSGGVSTSHKPPGKWPLISMLVKDLRKEGDSWKGRHPSTAVFPPRLAGHTGAEAGVQQTARPLTP